MNLFYSLKFTPLCKFMLQCTCIAQSLDHTWVEQSNLLSSVWGNSSLVSCWTQDQTRAGWHGFQYHLGQLIFIKELSLIFSVNTRCHYLLEPVVFIPLYHNENTAMCVFDITLNIGGSRGCAQCMPPYGTQFFRFRIHFYRKVPTSEVHVPLTGACPPYGKSWIRHC